MLDHHTRQLLGWVCGDRDVAEAILLTQTKQKTYQIEQNNSAQWRYYRPHNPSQAPKSSPKSSIYLKVIISQNYPFL